MKRVFKPLAISILSAAMFAPALPAQSAYNYGHGYDQAEHTRSYNGYANDRGYRDHRDNREYRGDRDYRDNREYRGDRDYRGGYGYGYRDDGYYRTHHGRDAAVILGSAAAGALIGGAAGHGQGAAIGAVVGGIAGIVADGAADHHHRRGW